MCDPRWFTVAGLVFDILGASIIAIGVIASKKGAVDVAVTRIAGSTLKENHKAAIALYFMHYNFARIHKTLRVTPAMEAGVADHVWSLDEIAKRAN